MNTGQQEPHGALWGVRPPDRSTAQGFAGSGVSPWSPECLSELYLGLWEGPIVKLPLPLSPREWRLHSTALTYVLGLILPRIERILVVSWF